MTVDEKQVHLYRSCDHAALIQTWLDEEASQNTGIENWDEDTQYWQKESPEEFHCLVFGNPQPSAAVYYFVNKSDLHIGELLVSSNQRGKGIGTAILRYLT